MRQSAQRTIEMQNNSPADIETAGFPIMIGGKAAIDRAFELWQKKRGMPVFSEWKSRRRDAPVPEKAKPILKKPPARQPIVKAPKAPKPTREEVRKRTLERQRSYRLANKEKIQESNRAYQQRRRDRMTPEQRSAEYKKVNEHRKRKRAGG